MKKFLTIVLTGLVLFPFSDCKPKKTPHEYYIISSGDSTNFSKKYNSADESGQLLPPPPPPRQQVKIEGGQFYFNTTIIFDASDLVYLYQTDQLVNNESLLKVPRGCIIDKEDDYYKFTEYPCFIDLKPSNLMKFSTRDFINFVFENQDILLDTANTGLRLFILASNKDTIINTAFYEFMNFIAQKQKTAKHIYYNIRRTTEEEDTVIYYKRRNKTYDPSSIRWSKNFLNGHYSPLSKEYDSVANKVIPIQSKARKLFRPDFTPHEND